MARPYLTPDEYWRDPSSFWIFRDPITGYPTMNSQNQFVYGRSGYPQAWVSSTDYVSPGTPAPPYADPTPIPSTNTSYAPPTIGQGFDQVYPEGLVGTTVDMPGTPVDPFANPSPIPAMPGYGSGYVNIGAGWNPQANVGGTDIADFGQNAVPYFPPPVAAGDYGIGAGPGSMSVGGNMTIDSGINWGPSLPPSPNVPFAWDYTPSGLPQANVGGNMTLGGYGGAPSSLPGFYGSPTDFGFTPSSNQYGWTPIDYSSASVGGDMTLGGFGGTPSDLPGFYGSPTDFGFTPSSNQYGWTPVDYSSAEPTLTPTDYSAIPWGGIDPVIQSLTPEATPFPTPVETPMTVLAPSTLSTPDTAPQDTIPAPSDWVDGLPPLTPPPDIPDVPADVTPDGTQLPDSGTGSGSGGGDSGASDAPISVPPGYTPAGFPIGYTPFASGVGPAFSPGLGIQSLSSFYGGPLTPGGSMSMPGMPGTFVSTPSGEVYSTAVGMFGLGAMNAPGGSFSLGMGGPESGISIRTQGDAPDFAFGKATNEAAKLGMSVDDYMAMMDSTTVGPTKFQTNALADPYKFWESRILQSRRMAAAGSGSQPSGPIGIDPTYSIDAARNAGMYKGWTFDPTAGTFVPPTTAKPSKGANK